MNVIQKSEAIKTGLRKGFQGGSSKMAKRKCYGYEVSSDGEPEINPDEAKVRVSRRPASKNFCSR
ncbi:hypothetical protein [uncultured Oscillibacter sp.]|uniref:hypothetical protein n=1 Tax=uncultured Oscillibacter sp. TaxID=876091 RepID=UPI00260F7180|nr:hypothetical protein [uncultured Oscillibacter sp.]